MDTEDFKTFIKEGSLWEVRLLEYKFTWFGPMNRKSKLDRFLINIWWPSTNNWQAIEDCRRGSDYIPLVLRAKLVNWGQYHSRHTTTGYKMKNSCHGSWRI